MPLVHVTTSAASPEPGAMQSLLGDLSREAARIIGKSEKWVMVAARCGVPMLFAGTPEPAAYVEVKSIGGFTPEVANALSAGLSAVLERHLGVGRERVYLELEPEEASLFGWNGETFG